MITLHTVAGMADLESRSPFCMKVEVYLKLQKIPYQIRLGDPRKAPKKKLPFIVDGDETIADSSAILARLEAKHDAPLDHGLDAEARARAHVLQRMFETSLYFVLVWARWTDDVGWEEFRHDLDKVIPRGLRWFVPDLIRKKVTASTFAQGTGRHSRDEIRALGAADLEAAAVLLGDQPYFLGDELHAIDVIAYAFLAQIVVPKTPTLMTDAVRSHENLVTFVERVRARVAAAASA